MLKGRGLAVFGAVLTIVAMAVDPFTQQIIQQYSCQLKVDGKFAKVPFSNNYTSGIAGQSSVGDAAGYVDAKMHLSMYTGLIDPPVNVSAALKFDCETGNCTLSSTTDGATFLTLALGIQCIDISRNIHYSVNSTQSSSHIGNITSKTLDVYETSASLLDYGISITDFNTHSSTLLVSGNKYSEGSPSSFLNKIAFLMQSTELNGKKAFECEFYPAVNTYGANITNGVLVEHLLNTQRMNIWPASISIYKRENYLGTHMVQSMLLINRTIRSGNWHGCEGVQNRSVENDIPIFSSSIEQGPTIGESYPTARSDEWSYTLWWPHDCVYHLPYTPTVGLSNSIYQFLGNETLLASGYGNTRGNLWSENLWGNNNASLDTVQKVMDGLALSVTARLRQGDGISMNLGPAIGTVWENQTCVRVNWPWITLPAALLLLTIVFLVLTSLRTSLARGLIWKSSLLAVLFNGLDEKTRQAAGPAAGLEEIIAASKTATVRLSRSDDGFRLVSDA